jgi:hypothetical protein
MYIKSILNYSIAMFSKKNFWTGANPTPFKFSATYNASVVVGWNVFTLEKNSFYSKNAIYY